MHANGRSGGVDLGDGALVGLGLAGAVSTALLVTRRRRRRFYVPGSGRRDDLLPAAPVVRNLHLAHLRATAQSAGSTEPDPDAGARAEAEADVDAEADRAHAHPPPNGASRGTGSGAAAADSHPPASLAPETCEVQSGGASPPSVSVGIVDGQEAAVDLAGLRGVGLVGPGAPGAARSLIVHLLATTVPGRTAGAGAEVLIPTDAAKALQLPEPGRCPSRLRIVADLAGALDAAETQLLRRARLASARSTDPARGALAGELVVVSAVPADTRRLQAILDAGAEAGVGAVLLGQWRPGTSLYLAADETVTATSPGPGEPLRGARLYSVTAADTAALLDQLRSADLETTRPAINSDIAARVNGDGAHSLHRPADSSPGETMRPEPTPVIPPSTRSAPAQPSHSDSGPVTTKTPTNTATTSRSVEHTHLNVVSREVADAADAASLTLTVLGPVRLTWSPPGLIPSPADRAAPTIEDITGALSPRLRELLVLVAVHPDGITRDRLADVLWPDTPAQRPFATLNTNLARLRRTIASATGGQVSEIVRTAGDRHQLDPAVVDTDFRVFSDALVARRAATSDEQRASAYRNAVAAYRGDLAEGLSAEWLETSREAVRRDAVDAATGLARLLAASDPRGALEMLETARAFDAYNEAIYRDIMRLQRRLGQTDAIERTLGLLTTRLTDLAETPEPETLALARRLRAPRSDPAQPAG